ncbi:MAG: DUF1552 domain-containing protein [Bryobacteraceae bacterium]|nr:DUF1552 domain-containing protein [Bryobacteraceae bacterium]
MGNSDSKSAPFLNLGRAVPRRQFLRGAGVALALPFLDAMQPAFGAEPETPRRMLAICNNLGLLPAGFFPRGTGKDYELSPYLQELKAHRERFTVFSGVSHPDVDGSHSSEVCFLTAAPHPANGGFRNSISLDQYMADQIGVKTRFPSLTLGVNVNKGQRSLTWTGAGVMIPCEDSAASLYRRLFLQGTQQEIEQQIDRLKLGESIMDSVAGHAGKLGRDLGPRDRARLDQYVTGVRELERRMVLSREWEHKPKPVTKEREPVDPADSRSYMEKVRLMYDMARLAFETDSTRLITLFLDSSNSPAIDVEGIQITDGYHNLSHHGKNESKLAQLEAIDKWQMRLLAELYGKLQSIGEAGGTLLDRSSVLYGSNFGDANKHTTTNMPIILAGGGFKHGQHLAFDTERNYPLPNLFVSLLQRMGIESTKFASSTGTMRGLEMLG